MSTVLLYQQDDYMRLFEATVVGVDEGSGSVILDATAFYPTGGHQRCDQGRIEKGRNDYWIVTDVQKDDAGVVRHACLAARGHIQVGDRVRGSIHWSRRYRHMQLHTAQHIFSRFALDRFGVATGRADFAPEGGLAVMENPITWEQMLLLEDDVNRVIAEGRAVSRSIDDNGTTSITVDRLDENHCGGTHVRSTAEIGLFKITSVHNRNLNYEVGERARQIAIRVANHALEAAALFETHETKTLADRVRSLMAERNEAHKALEEQAEKTTQKQVQIAQQTAVPLNGAATIFRLELSHLSTKAVKEMVKKKLIADGQVWVCLADRRNLLIASRSDAVRADELLREFVGPWGMQGGGNPGFAQGGPVPDSVADPLDQVAQKLRSRDDEAGFGGASPTENRIGRRGPWPFGA